MRRVKAVMTTMVVLLAFAGGWIVGGKGSSPAQAQGTVLSHFKCYSIVGGKNPRQIADLQDQFIFEPNVAVNKAKLLCTPVFKTNVRPPGFPDPPGADHLECYGVKLPQLAALPLVDLSNQFGTEAAVQVVQPQFLCVPTIKQPAG